MLVVFGETCIVVEIKNCGFRAPFRDPTKAYPRIKRDYENAEKALDIYNKTIGPDHEETMTAKQTIEEIQKDKEKSGLRD